MPVQERHPDDRTSVVTAGDGDDNCRGQNDGVNDPLHFL